MSCPARTSISWIVGVADDEPLGRADRDADLQREAHRASRPG